MGIDYKSKAALYFAQGFSCSQSVLAAFSEDLGLDSVTALKIGCGFGAGCARTGQTCGAVTGAYVVIGLKHGKAEPEDSDSREKTYAMVSEFNRRFLDAYNSLNCTELTGFFLGDSAEYQKAAESGVFEITCMGIIEKSAAILQDIL